MTTEKSCGVCGADLRERSRIKRSDGEYRCRTCEHRSLARAKRLVALRRLGLWVLFFAVAVASTVVLVKALSAPPRSSQGFSPIRR